MNAVPAPWTCPRDGTPLQDLTCPTCGTAWPVQRNIPDLLDPPLPPPSAAQRTMMARPVTLIYERWWRPAWSALGGQVGYAEEEAFLLAAVDGQRGAALDVATGTGRYARILAKEGLGPVYALDASWPMLEQAARRASPELRLVHARADHIPLPDTAVQVVTCFGALHLFPEPSRVLAELVRVLAPGGTLVLHTACTSRDGTTRTLQRVLGASGLRDLPLDALLEELDGLGMDVQAWQAEGAVALISARRRPPS